MSGTDTLENVIVEYVHFTLEEYKYEEVNNNEICDITIQYILRDYQENTYVIENEKAIREFILFYIENVAIIETEETDEVQAEDEVPSENKINSNIYLLIMVSLFIIILFKTLTLKQKNQNLQNIVDKLIPERLL